MGTAIGDLLTKNEITLDQVKEKTLGFDGNNITYQFLTTIRGLDGELLTNSKGKVTSHLIGLFYRISSILENDVKVMFVFDGKPLELKKETLQKRKDMKIEAEEKARKAEEEEDFEERAKQMKRATKITSEMIDDAKKFFDVFGIPYIDAPNDGEAQISWMNSVGKLDGVVTQDFDSLLFGAKDVYRNLTLSGKRRVPGKDYFVQIKPEHINAEETLKAMEINRQKLIWLGMLVGTDFNNKIPKIGPKTAIRLVKEINSFDEILKKLNYEPDFDPDEIEALFMNPPHVENYKLEWKEIDFDKTKKLLIEEFEFAQDRVDNTLERLEKVITERKKQPRLSKWF